MTNNKKQKKQIRARMERTGESYTTARRAVLTPSFRSVVEQVIACAKALEVEPRMFTTSEIVASAMKSPSAVEDRVEKLLLSSSVEYQQKLRTLMYFGRDHDEETEDDILSLHKYLKGLDSPKFGPVENMMDKAPLSRYLAQGLAKCDSAAIDVEKSFDAR